MSHNIPHDAARLALKQAYGISTLNQNFVFQKSKTISTPDPVPSKGKTFLEALQLAVFQMVSNSFSFPRT